MEPFQAGAGQPSFPYHLRPSQTPGARVEEVRPGRWRRWRMEIPAGPAGQYRLAQLDDYGSQPRRDFPHRPPFRLRLKARASHSTIPGTWGFGLWNNPFGMAILSGVEVLRLPALPNTAWFFYGSPPNYLALHDQAPARGWMATTFRTASLLRLGLRQRLEFGLAAWMLSPPVLPWLALSGPARLMGVLRRLGQALVRQEGAVLPVDPAEWHTYEMLWQRERVTFKVDDRTVAVSAASPHPPLGLVIWIDNQWAALPPTSLPGFGTLANPEPAWIEIEDLLCETTRPEI